MTSAPSSVGASWSGAAPPGTGAGVPAGCAPEDQAEALGCSWGLGLMGHSWC